MDDETQLARLPSLHPLVPQLDREAMDLLPWDRKELQVKIDMLRRVLQEAEAHAKDLDNILKKNEPRRKRPRATVKTVNPWLFHMKKEQAMRACVNDPQNPKYNPKHPYFGKSAISRKGRWDKDFQEDDSIMPLLRNSYKECKEQIILSMINQKAEDENSKTYWSTFSADLKNDFIKKIKELFPYNKAIRALQLSDDSETDDSIFS